MTQILRTCALIVALFTSGTSRGAVFLGFDADVPGTITDQNGLGTGFTHRLPGTGSAIAINDPNMDLSANPGRLLLQSTLSNIGAGGNLDGTETPGVLISGVSGQDFVVTMVARNVDLSGHAGTSGHLSIYVGTSNTNLIRAGLHDNNSFAISSNNGGGDVTEFGDISYHFAYDSGDDMEIVLRRTSGMWSLSWSNLSNPSAAIPSGSSPQFAFPFIDAQSDLYFGIVAADPTPGPKFVGTIDSFSVEIGAVPEPSSIVLWTCAVVLTTASMGYRRRRVFNRLRAGVF